MASLESRPIDCEEALRRLAEYLDRELTGTARSEVGDHLATCRSCYSRAEFEEKLRTRLRELGHTPVDTAFEHRICELARGFTPPSAHGRAGAGNSTEEEDPWS